MNDLSKNMNQFFNNLIDTMPKSKNTIYTKYGSSSSNNFYKNYVEHNLLLIFLLLLLIIIIGTYFYWNNDIKSNIDKKNIIDEVPLEKDNIDYFDNMDKETLLNIIDELSTVNEKQYKLQQQLKQKEEYYSNLQNQLNNTKINKNDIFDNDSYSNNGNFDNYQNINNNNNIIDVDGVKVQSPFSK